MDNLIKDLSYLYHKHNIEKIFSQYTADVWAIETLRLVLKMFSISKKYFFKFGFTNFKLKMWPVIKIVPHYLLIQTHPDVMKLVESWILQ